MGTQPPVVHLRAELRAAGYGDDEVRQLVRSGELTTVRRGAYLRGGLPDDRAVRHLAEIRAAAAQLSVDAVVSHVSAAVVRGWDVWGVALGRVRVTRARHNGGRIDPGLHVRTAPLREDELEVVDEVLVTSGARIVVDVARTVPFEQAVVVADCALAKGDVDAEALAGRLLAGGWRLV
ncbi:MAG: type IV toxin-antitoxin system AbiEi family antitoxin domain-containing protein, partial [Pseudonocardia sp.]|nr:type IV toxin-antitoxin system AbiEi family antitoxin domain-containing protein [Pseudonocardia sp.]